MVIKEVSNDGYADNINYCMNLMIPDYIYMMSKRNCAMNLTITDDGYGNNNHPKHTSNQTKWKNWIEFGWGSFTITY